MVKHRLCARGTNAEGCRADRGRYGAQRCTMVDALNCEYMTALHQGRELPPTETTFSFDFEKPDITQDELRELIWSEMANFHPELR